jgi:tetratricopeptide (TPR) repeat protein
VTSEPRPEDLRALVEECLVAFETGGEAGLEAVIARHPAVAPRLRKRLQALRETVLLASARVVADAMPAHLGEFRLVERLGSGGMGVVYRAVQVSLGREVALKVVRPEQLFFPGARERFRREVDAVARLQHPGIVPIHTVGEQGGVPYFAMELIAGEGLDAIIARLSGRAPESLHGRDLESICGGSRPAGRGDWPMVCAQIAWRVADALAHAHERGVLHRDVKPSNVMLGTDGRVMLLDFGLAAAEGSHRLTRTGSQLGSLPYMAPEQLRGEAVDARTDVRALGVTLHELLTLQSPFGCDHDERVKARILGGEVPALRARNRAVPRDLENLVSKAIDPDPARRYASARALADDLERFLAGLPVAARPIGIVLATARRLRRHPVLATLLVAVPLLAIAALLAIGHYRESARIAVATGLRDTLGAIDRLAAQASDPRLEKQPGLDALRAAQLDDVVARLVRIRAEHGELRDVRVAHIRGLLAAGRLWRTLGEPRRAAALLESAESELRADPSGQDPADFVDVLLELGHVRRHRGDLDGALTLWDEALARIEGPASLASADARTLSLAASLHADRGMVKGSSQRFADAEPDLRRAMEYRGRLAASVGGRDARIADLRLRSNHSVVLSALGRLDEARDELRGMVADALALVGEDGAEPEARRELARARAGLGRNAQALGDATVSRESYATAADGFAELAADFPQRIEYRIEQALTEFGAAEAAASRGDHEEEAQRLDRAITLHTGLMAIDRERSETWRELATMLDRAGIAHQNAGRAEAAIACFDRAIATLEELVTLGRAEAADHLALGLSHYNRALQRRRAANVAAVKADVSEALDRFAKAVAGGAPPVSRDVLMQSHRMLAECHVADGDPTAAIAALTRMQAEAPMPPAMLESLGTVLHLDARDEFRALLAAARTR